MSEYENSMVERSLPAWSSSYHHEIYEENSWLKRFVWMVVGFNVGFIIPTVVLFIVLPAVFPEIRLHENTRKEEARVIVVTSTPSATPIPSTTPLPTDVPPTVEVTEAPEIVAAPPTLEPTEILPTATPWPTATMIPPTATPLPAPATYELTGFTYQKQTWNNCGPANLAMGLSYYEWQGTQVDTARYLKPNREDKNVSPDQMAAYVNENTNLKAIYRVAGTLDMLKWLVSSNFVVLVESGYQPEGEDWYGHYRTVVGYDDNRAEFYFYDSYLGSKSAPRVAQSYRGFDRDWQAFNRTFIVIYPEWREPELSAFLGRDWIERANWRYAADVAAEEAAAEPDNPYAWFNLGTSLTMMGDYQRASLAFDQARSLGLPWRFLWYQFAIYEAYFQTSRLDDVISLAQATLKTTPYVEETYFYLGRVYELWGDSEAAIQQYQEAARFNPNYRPAQEAVARLGG